MNSDNYLIGELAQKAGVSVRTIRYYISEGLLPSPEVRGRYTNYDEDYLRRIRLIRRLKDAYLPIKEIRRKLETESEEEIEAFLRLYEGQHTSREGALEYIANLRAESAPRAKIMPPAPRPVITVEAANPTDPAESSWRRIRLAPGIELHLSEATAAQLGARLPALLADLRRRVQEFLSSF